MRERTSDKKTVVYSVVHFLFLSKPRGNTDQRTTLPSRWHHLKDLKQMESHTPLMAASVSLWLIEITENFLRQAKQIHFHENQP
jgi:hypothetical protein